MDNRVGYVVYHRKYSRLQKFIMAIAVVFIILPSVLCVILFDRMNKMQSRIDELAAAGRQGSVAGQAEAEDEDDGMDGALYNESDDTQALKDASDIKYSRPSDIVRDEDRYHGARVYLTFDDGPSDNTDAILDKLGEYGVKATFFVVMKEDEKSVERYKRIVNEGHTLAMHSASHVYSQIYSSYDAYTEDVNQLRSYLKSVTGVTPVYYRFPGGSSNTVSSVPMSECIEYLDSQGIIYYDWNVASGDTDRAYVSSSTIADNVIRGVEGKKSSVVLMHDTNKKTTTVDALDSILKYMSDTGKNVLPITEGTTPVHHRISDAK